MTYRSGPYRDDGGGHEIQTRPTYSDAQVGEPVRQQSALVSGAAPEPNSVAGVPVRGQLSPGRLLLRPGVVQAEVFALNIALLLTLWSNMDARSGALLSLMVVINGFFIATLVGVFCASLPRRGRSLLPSVLSALIASLASAFFVAGLVQVGLWRISEAARALSNGVSLDEIARAGIMSVGAPVLGAAVAVPMLSLAIAAASVTRAYLADHSPSPMLDAGESALSQPLIGSVSTPSHPLIAAASTPSGTLLGR